MVEFIIEMQGCFQLYPGNQYHYLLIQKMKGKKSYNHLNRCKQHLTKHSFMTKHSQQSGYRGMYLNIIKIIYDKPTTNIIIKS